MRKEFYLAVRERLLSRFSPIKYVGLWNNNVEYIEQETGWPRPAVFVEFCAFRWDRVGQGGDGVSYASRGEVRFHIVTDSSEEMSCSDGSAELSRLMLSEYLQASLYGLRGDWFGHVELVCSMTNHNHGEIIDDVEVYEVSFHRKVLRAELPVRVPFRMEGISVGGHGIVVEPPLVL